MHSSILDSRVLAATLLLFLTCTVYAAEAPRYDQIHLQAQSSMTVENDRMQAVMSVLGEDIDAAKLADQLNGTMAWALKTAKKYPRVDVGSGDYQTFPVYQKDALKRWRATQEVLLESAAFPELVQLLGQLQQRLQVNAIRFSVSAAQRSRAEDQLIDQALAAFRARAERVRKDLDAKSYRIVDLSVGSNPVVAPPYAMLRAQATEVAESVPAVESGRSTLTVNVEGTIELQH